MKRKITVFLLSITLMFQTASLFAANYPAYKAYLKGVMAMKSGEFDSARKEYERVIALDSSAVAVYKDLAYLYWQMGSNAKAIKTAEKIDEIDGNNPQTTVFLGTFYLIANEPDSARKFWEKTLEIDPDNETATVYLAAYYYSDNKLQESIEYWNKFLQQQPDSSAGYFQLAMVQEKLNMNAEALNSYNEVIKLKPEAREAYISKARIYEKTEKFDLAIHEYEKYVDAFPDNLYVLMYLGKCYYETGEYEKAKSAFLKAKKGLQGDVTASYWLGIIYEKFSEFDKAAIEFEYLSTKERTVSVLARLGYYYSLSKDYKKAEKRLLSAMEIEPYNYELLYLAALNYMDWEKYDKAIEYLLKTVEVAPEYAEGYFFLASSYDKTGNFEKAEENFFKVLEMQPEHARAMNYLGYSYADKNIKLDAAEALLNQAVKLSPDNGAYLDSLGWLYYRQGRYEPAKKLIAAAAQLTGDPLIYDHLGDTCVELGQLKDAWIAYAYSCDINEDKDVRKKLNMVQAKLDKQVLYVKMLERSEINYKKLPSFKTGYKAKFSSGLFSAKTYLPINYTKNEGMLIELPQRFIMGGASIHVKNKEVSFEPKALVQSLPRELVELVYFAAHVFNDDFFSSFLDAEITEKGKEFIYFNHENNTKLVLDSKTALVKEISRNDISIEPLKYKKFFIFKFPSKIKVISKEPKFNAVFELTNFTGMASKTSQKEHEKENEDNTASSGKN